MTLQLLPSEFPHILYEENLIFFFISVPQNYLLNYMYCQCTPLDCVYPAFLFQIRSLVFLLAKHLFYNTATVFLLTGWMITLQFLRSFAESSQCRYIHILLFLSDSPVRTKIVLSQSLFPAGKSNVLRTDMPYLSA